MIDLVTFILLFLGACSLQTPEPTPDSPHSVKGTHEAAAATCGHKDDHGSEKDVLLFFFLGRCEGVTKSFYVYIYVYYITNDT